jgi:hypothetical protein
MILRHTITGSRQDISQYFAEKSEQHKEFDVITSAGNRSRNFIGKGNGDFNSRLREEIF